MKWLAYIVLVIGGLVFTVFLYMSRCSGLKFAEEGYTDWNVTGGVGDFVGGVVGSLFTLASTLLVVETLNDQRKQYRRERFAQTFYEMLRIHNENTLNLSDGTEYGITKKGHEFMSALLSKFKIDFINVDKYIENMVNSNELVAGNNQILENKNELKKLTLRLTYGYYFEGLDNFSLDKDEPEAARQIERHVKELFHNTHSTINGVGGYIGHYYRHLYQIIKIVNDEKDMKKNIRLYYAEQLRAQLSEDEQYLLFYHAMSDIGKYMMPQLIDLKMFNEIKDRNDIVDVFPK